MFKSLRQKYTLYLAHQRRRDAFFMWIQKSLHETSVIYVKDVQLWGTQIYSVEKGSAKRIRQENQIDYILRTPHEVVEEIRSHEWSMIFKTPVLEIWKKTSVRTKYVFDTELSKDEMSSLSKSVRLMLKEYLETHKRPHHPFLQNAKFSKSYGVDIGLWVSGKMHGSKISFKNTLRESLVEALMASATDERFKAFTLNDLPNTIIEISILSTLHIPLRKEEIASHQIYFDMGYVAQKHGKPVGWYIPMVFNDVTHFKSFSNFTESLVFKKATLPDRSFLDVDINIFTVHNFIESANHSGTLPLQGPIPLYTQINTSDLFQRAAEWIIQNTHTDGYIEPVTTQPPREIALDVVRQMFTAYALAAYSIITLNNEGLAAARKIALFAHSHIPHITNENQSLLAEIYYALYLDVLGEKKLASAICTLVSKSISEKTDTITLSQFTILSTRVTPHKLEEISKYIAILLKRFKHSQEHASLAEYAELLPLTKKYNKAIYPSISRWYISLQHELGYFPNKKNDSFYYTRGTGKVLEACAASGDFTEEVKKGLVWLARSQYTDDTLYHIPTRERGRYRGGFRHDIFNRDAWIDSAGHALLTGAYLLKNQLNMSLKQ